MSTVPVVMTEIAEIALTEDQRETEAIRRVLFFDGVCGLCNWSIDFIMKRDTRNAFQFAPLQGETAKRLLTESDVQNLKTLVLFVNGRTYRRSAAAVRVLWQLSPFWLTVGSMIWLIPLPLRDLGYWIIASNRYRLFGKKETCRIPTPEERAKFLP